MAGGILDRMGNVMTDAGCVGDRKDTQEDGWPQHIRMFSALFTSRLTEMESWVSVTHCFLHRMGNPQEPP